MMPGTNEVSMIPTIRSDTYHYQGLSTLGQSGFDLIHIHTYYSYIIHDSHDHISVLTILHIVVLVTKISTYYVYLPYRFTKVGTYLSYPPTLPVIQVSTDTCGMRHVAIAAVTLASLTPPPLPSKPP